MLTQPPRAAWTDQSSKTHAEARRNSRGKGVDHQFDGAAEATAGSTEALHAASVDTDAMAKHDFDALVKMAGFQAYDYHE